MQLIKFNNAYCSCKEIFYGIQQGLILEPLLFNIFLCNLIFLLEDTDIANCAGDTLPLGAAYLKSLKILCWSFINSSVTTICK